PGDVHQDVESAERVDGGLDQVLRALRRRHIVTVDDGVASGGLDLGHDLLGRVLARVRAVRAGAEIVDDDLRPLRREGQRVLAPDSPPGTGHDDDAAVHQSAHCIHSLSGGTRLVTYQAIAWLLSPAPLNGPDRTARRTAPPPAAPGPGGPCTFRPRGKA